MENLCCLGCGSKKTIEEIRKENPNAISCCPERKLVHPEYRKGYDAGYQSAMLNLGVKS